MWLTIQVRDSNGYENTSTIMIVDLAGAEAAHRNSGDHREGSGINKSLMSLKQCVTALSKRKERP